MARARILIRNRPAGTELFAENRGKADAKSTPASTTFDVYRLVSGQYTYLFPGEPVPEGARRTAHYRLNGGLWVCESK